MASIWIKEIFEMKCQALDKNKERQWFDISAEGVGVYITTPSGERYSLVRDQVLEAVGAISNIKQGAYVITGEIEDELLRIAIRASHLTDNSLPNNTGDTVPKSEVELLGKIAYKAWESSKFQGRRNALNMFLCGAFTAIGVVFILSALCFYIATH